MQNGEPLKVLTLLSEGALKNIATIFQEKLSLHGYGVDLCEFYDLKRGSLNFLRSEREASKFCNEFHLY